MGESLRDVLQELTQDHARAIDGHLGVEPPLLRMLEVAIGADTSGASGGAGRSKNSAPLDVTALTLWDEISSTINSHWPGRGDHTQQHLHLIDRLTWWARVLLGGPNEHHLMEFCVYWRKQIRDLLEPPRRIPLRGVPCLSCKQVWVIEEQGQETTRQPTMTATIPRDGDMIVRCCACNAEFNSLGLQLVSAVG